MASRDRIGDAFIVPTKAGILRYLRKVFRGALTKYDRLVLPCSGLLTLAEAAVDCGWRTGEVRATDTNIMSAVLGTMAAGGDLEALGIDFPGDSTEAQWARNWFASGHEASAIFMALKLAHLRGSRDTMDRLAADEIWENRERYAREFQGRAARLAEKLSGLDFAVEDVTETVNGNVMDDRAVIVVDPWRAPGKPFDCVGIGPREGSAAVVCWNKPLVAAFDPRTGMDALRHSLMPGNALALFHTDRDLTSELRRKAVYVCDRGHTDFVYCNRPNEAQRLAQGPLVTEIEAAPCPVVSAEDLRMDDVLTLVCFVPCTREQATYYTDLWGVKVPRFGFSFFVMLAGRIAGVVGVSFLDIRQSRGPWVRQTYLAVPPLFPNLEYLCQMACVSRQAQELFDHIANAPLHAVQEYRLTYVGRETEYHPARAARMDVVKSELTDDRQYRIEYVRKFDGASSLSTLMQECKAFLRLEGKGEHLSG